VKGESQPQTFKDGEEITHNQSILRARNCSMDSSRASRRLFTIDNYCNEHNPPKFSSTTFSLLPCNSANEFSLYTINKIHSMGFNKGDISKKDHIIQKMPRVVTKSRGGGMRA
jgi:hypothetical protein